MSSVAYVNGRYVRRAEAGVSIEDRGLQFADSIYEVWGVRAGRLLDEAGHLERLYRSLREIRMRAPMSERALRIVLREMQRRNHLRDGHLYLQVTRGAAKRDHMFPSDDTPATIIITATASDPKLEQKRARGLRVITAPDLRWRRCDIKTTSLLANVLAKQTAKEAGAQEAWLLDSDGLITEGASSNAWIVDRDGVLRTRSLSQSILPGITRERVLKLARERQIPTEERAFTLEEALAAREAFITSATGGPVGVIAIDGETIGDGAPGPVTRRLHDAYFGAEPG